MNPQPISNYNISAREIYLLRKEVKTLRQTVQIYDETQCVKSSLLSEKFEAMKKVECKFSHKALCKTLDVKKGTSHNHLYRKVETRQFQQSDEIYRAKLLESFYLTEERFGSKKLCTIIKSEGYYCSHKRVMRLMKKLNLKCKRAVRDNNIVIPRKSSNPELKRDFYPSEPNKA